MTESKHTPGPWYATTRQGSWDWLVAQSDRLEICQMFHDGSGLNQTGEANARLVAAAPDLLDALRWYEEQARNCRKIGGVPEGHAARAALDADGGKRALAAIAKAEGR